MSKSDLLPAQITSLHLYNLSHATPFLPSNKHYSSQLIQHNAENIINLPPAVSNKFCTSCGVIWIPGLTVSVRILYRHKSKKSQSKPSKNGSKRSPRSVPSRRLQYKCLQCKHKEIQSDLIQIGTKKVKEAPASVEIPATGQVPTSSSTTPVPEIKDNKKSKERSKKRKKNTLGGLLEEKKKQQEASRGGLNSLNLMEFMK